MVHVCACRQNQQKPVISHVNAGSKANMKINWGTYNNNTWKWNKVSFYSLPNHGEVVYHFGKMFSCLSCMSAFGPQADLATQPRSLQSMSRFSTHTNEVNGWLLFSPQFQLPPKCSHDLYKSRCRNQPWAFNQISNSTEWSICVAIFICHTCHIISRLHQHVHMVQNNKRTKVAVYL